MKNMKAWKKKAYYGIPSVIREKALVFLEDDLAEIVDEFEKKFGK